MMAETKRVRLSLAWPSDPYIGTMRTSHGPSTSHVPTRLHTAVASYSYVGFALQLLRAASEYSGLPSVKPAFSRFDSVARAQLPTIALASHATKRLEMSLKAIGPCNLSLTLSSNTRLRFCQRHTCREKCGHQTSHVLPTGWLNRICRGK